MNKIILLSLLLFVSFGYTLIDTNELNLDNCEGTGNNLVCHSPTKIDGAGTLIDDLDCFSDAPDSFNKGCYITFTLNQDSVVSDCTFSANNVTKEITYNACQSVIIKKETILVGLVNPNNFDYSTCTKYEDNGVYVMYCQWNNTAIKFSGVMNLADNEGYLVIITQLDLNNFDLWKLILNNLIYIILIAIILIIVYWMFIPHNQKPKEKIRVKEIVSTRREKRYGR